MRRLIIEGEIPKVGSLLGSVVDAGARRARDAGDTLVLWLQRHRQRHRLATLSDHLLSDMGLSRREVVMESEKPFWRK